MSFDDMSHGTGVTANDEWPDGRDEDGTLRPNVTAAGTMHE
jgi:hypothetical protein